jgi:hypothetical protein
MHPDLARIAGEFDAAQARVYRLAESVEDALWTRRPVEGRWSIDECIAHLTITNQRYLPIFAEVADAAPQMDEPPPPMRPDLTGRMLAWFMEPPVRFRLPTAPSFEPPSSAGRVATVALFDAMQARLGEQIRAMDGFDISKIRMASPFNEKVRYSAFSALCILAAHERRHLWQAEQVRAQLLRST